MAKTAMNSTWAIFAPGQIRGPADQGRKVPRGGVKMVELLFSDGTNQRVGRKRRASGPQVFGSVCMALELT